MARPPRHGQPLAVEDGSQQGSKLPRPSPRLFGPRRRVLMVESKREKEVSMLWLSTSIARESSRPRAGRRPVPFTTPFLLGKPVATEGQDRRKRRPAVTPRWSLAGLLAGDPVGEAGEKEIGARAAGQRVDRLIVMHRQGAEEVREFLPPATAPVR